MTAGKTGKKNKIKAEIFADTSRVGHCSPRGEWDVPEEFTAGLKRKGLRPFKRGENVTKGALL